ncbi:MAG: hypothetical protein AAF518_29080 [Spirochaetota bacterium]
MNKYEIKELAEIPNTVSRGIDLMVSKHGLKFFDMIDLDKLDLRSGCDCVLGQMHDDFIIGLGKEGIESNGAEYGFTTPQLTITRNGHESLVVGFDSIHEIIQQFFEALTAEWKKQITMWRERLKEDNIDLIRNMETDGDRGEKENDRGLDVGVRAIQSTDVFNTTTREAQHEQL